MNFFGMGEDNNDKREREAEQRQMSFQSNENVKSAVISPNDEMVYMQQQNDKSSLIKWQQELDGELFQLKMNLLSLRYDESQDQVVPITHSIIKDGNIVSVPVPPICNEVFIYQVVEPKLRPFLNKNMINSKFDERQIRDTLKYTFNDVADMMSDNFDLYGIEFTNWDGVIRDMKTLAHSSINRAWGGWTKTSDNSSTKQVFSYTGGVEGDHKSNGFMGLFGGKT